MRIINQAEFDEIYAVTFGRQRRFLSLELSDTPYRRKLAQDRALEIERDIQYGEFDTK